MKAILPPDGRGISVTSGTYTGAREGQPQVLVMIEIAGGPIITLTPQQWAYLVNRIRGARTIRELGV